MTSWYAIRARGTGAEVAIYDEIGAFGVSAKGFLAELGALPDGTPVDLRLNSPGGSVFDAVAIYNALKRHEGTVTVWIDGIAASAASYVAMAGDEIIMPENAFLMIHDPSGLAMGTAGDMRAMAEALDKIAGILADKHHDAPSAFTPESLLREARRQKGAVGVAVPKVCLLDPDGDIVRQLRAEGRARRHEGWVCYHTDMWVFDLDGHVIGVVGCAVGASFAVLVAEEMFASGCELLISVTSSGQITPQGAPPYFIVIDRALRDEGTSYHYLPPARFSQAPGPLIERLEGAFDDLGEPVLRGATWTTDAPFRETVQAIDAMRAEGLLAVEMEAAALYAFAAARGKAVVCFAHVTNQMGQIESDFEKGTENGTADALAVVSRDARRLCPGR